MSDQCNHELSMAKKLGYSLGIFGQFLPLSFIATFISTYWIYVIGLHSSLVNLATAIGAILLAILGPTMGTVADNLKFGKLGKKRPLLLYSIIPFCVSSVLIFYAPEVCSEFGEMNIKNTIYLIGIMFCLYLSFGVMRAPYLSLIADLTNNEEERVQIASFQGIFQIVSTVIAIVLPMFLMSALQDPKQIYYSEADQAYMMRILPLVAIIFSSIGGLCLFVTFFSVKETPPKSLLYKDEMNKESETISTQGEGNTNREGNLSNGIISTSVGNPEKKSFGEVLKQIFVPFKDIGYSYLLLTLFCVNMIFRVVSKIITPVAAIVIRLQGTSFIYFMIGIIPFAGLGFLYWSKAAQKNLKSAFLKCLLYGSISLIMVTGLFFLNDTLTIQIYSYINLSFALFCLVCVIFIPNPLIAKYSDDADRQDEMGSEISKSGVYFGAYMFTLNVANAVGDVLLGWIIAGERADDPFYLTLVFPILALFFIAAYIIFNKTQE